MVVDFRRARSLGYPVYIEGVIVEMVNSMVPFSEVVGISEHLQQTPDVLLHQSVMASVLFYAVEVLGSSDRKRNLTTEQTSEKRPAL